MNEKDGRIVENRMPHMVFSSFCLIETTFKNALLSCIPAHWALKDQDSPNRISDIKNEGLGRDLHDENNPILNLNI